MPFAGEPSEELNDQIEEMMRIILSQGRMICDGLKVKATTATESTSSKSQASPQRVRIEILHSSIYNYIHFIIIVIWHFSLKMKEKKENTK